ncbi:MAG: LysE family translocator [Rhodobacteraceae bacterium]|nr:LysE family translocator [Paracoccaceae bacterium]
MLADVLPTAATLSTFVIASFVLAVVPGPAVLYIVARSTLQGRQYGLASVAGVALGNFGNALGASLGLAALFALSSLAFTVVKWLGAGYLVYLGLKAILKKNDVQSLDTVPSKKDLQRIFQDGFVVALLNPKTALFFAAFLPQFLNPNGNIAAQSILFGAIFVLVAGATDTVYAFATSGASRALLKSPRVQALSHYAVGGTFIGLGVLAALSSQPARKP